MEGTHGNPGWKRGLETTSRRRWLLSHGTGEEEWGNCVSNSTGGCTPYAMCWEFQAVFCHLLKCQGTGNRGRNKTTEIVRGQIIKGLLYQEKAQSTCLDMHMTAEA